MVSEAQSGDVVRPLKRGEYEQLAAAGVFGDEKLELIRGVIVRMNPQGVPHAGVIELLDDILRRAVGAHARVRAQLPLALGLDSEPEPDIAVVPLGSPFAGHPTSAFLVVEIANTSL